MTEAKESLMNDVGTTANWRWKKADQYPTDSWNKHAAGELEELYAYLKSLNDDHPVFEWYNNWEDNIEYGWQVLESFNMALKSYGYQNSDEQPKEFVERIMEEGLDARNIYR